MEDGRSCSSTKCLICASDAGALNQDLELTSDLNSKSDLDLQQFAGQETCQNVPNDPPDLLKSQTSVIFILNKLLRLPESKGAELLAKYGNPSQWGCTYCSKCAQEVKKGLGVWTEIQELERQLRGVQDKLRNELIKTYPASSPTPSGFKDALQDIRQSIYQDMLPKSKDIVDVDNGKRGLSASRSRKIKRKSVPAKLMSNHGLDHNESEEFEESRATRLLRRSSRTSQDCPESVVQLKQEVEEVAASNYNEFADDSPVLPFEEGMENMLAEVSIKQEVDYESAVSHLELKFASDMKSEEESEDFSGDEGEDYQNSGEESSMSDSSDNSDYSFPKKKIRLEPGRKRGRPRKPKPESDPDKPKRGRGRPRKPKPEKIRKRGLVPKNYKEIVQCDICGKTVTLGALPFHLQLHSDSLKFKCRGCTKEFKRKDYWELHEETHVYQKGKVFNCSLCPEKFFGKSNYLKHLRKKHEAAMTTAANENVNVPYVQTFYHCDDKECKNCYENHDDFIKHVEIHWQGGEKLQCTTCLQYFAGAELMKKHDEDVHINKVTPYGCKYCPFSLETESDLEAHLMFHKVEWKLFEDHLCQECGQMFENMKRLKNHIYIVHMKEKNKSPPDTAKTPEVRTKRRRRGHGGVQNIVNSDVCKICGEHCLNRKALEEHCKTTGHMSFQCTRCDSKYKLLRSLYQHSMTHSANRTYITCPHCDKRFLANAARNRHVVKEHRDIVDPEHKLFFCACCYNSFETEEEVNSHMNATHSNFQCKICQRFFFDTTKLKDHVRSHTGERPFPCQFCPKAFSMEINKVEHERTHTGEKPFGCPALGCDRWFLNSRFCKNHMKKEHPEIQYDLKQLRRRDCPKTESSSRTDRRSDIGNVATHVHYPSTHGVIDQDPGGNHDASFINQAVWNSFV